MPNIMFIARTFMEFIIFQLIASIYDTSEIHFTVV